MRMLGTCIDEQVAKKIVTKTCLREHTLYCSPDKLFGACCENLFRCCEPLSAGISGVTGVNTVGHLISLEGHLLGVDNDDVVTTVNVGGETGFGLATKDKSNAGSETTKSEICSVKHYPLLLYGCLVKRYRLVALCLHCLDL